MIKAGFIRSQGNLVSFNIKGHAGYAEEGSDIVCSAVSTLTCSIGDGIIEVLKIKAKHQVKDGFLSLSLENENIENIENSQILLETLLLGLKNIELMYSEHIKVTVEEV